jgi:uncharacterized DUF497 family protein
MKFEWDKAKSEACFRERGFDFEYGLISATATAKIDINYWGK